MGSKFKVTDQAKFGDLLQIFVKLQNKKRGKCFSAKSVLSYDKMSSIITVPGQNVLRINLANENIRFAVIDKEISLKYQEANKTMDSAIDESIDSLTNYEAMKLLIVLKFQNLKKLELRKISVLETKSKYTGQ